jgi:hypothetical protein
MNDISLICYNVELIIIDSLTDTMLITYFCPNNAIIFACFCFIS